MTNKRVQILDGVLTTQVGDELVLLNINTEIYYGIDPVGARIWAVVTTSDSIEHALEILVDEFDVELNTLKQDVETLVNNCVEYGLVEITDDNTSVKDA